MANIVTIDNYRVETHKRYATDQEILDLTCIEDSDFIPRHFEMANGDFTIASKWEELFGLHLHKHPFATFAPPPMYAKMRKRFFSYSISPELDWIEEDENDEDQQKEEQQNANEYRKKIITKKSKSTPPALFEKDRKALLKLFDSVEILNGFLREIHARKLQFQKG